MCDQGEGRCVIGEGEVCDQGEVRCDQGGGV